MVQDKGKRTTKGGGGGKVRGEVRGRVMETKQRIKKKIRGKNTIKIRRGKKIRGRVNITDVWCDLQWRLANRRCN